MNTVFLAADTSKNFNRTMKELKSYKRGTGIASRTTKQQNKQFGNLAQSLARMEMASALRSPRAGESNSTQMSQFRLGGAKIGSAVDHSLRQSSNGTTDRTSLGSRPGQGSLNAHRKLFGQVTDYATASTATAGSFFTQRNR